MISVLLISRDMSSFLKIDETLKENSIETDQAESGGAALSIIQEKAFDLVITDEKLSDMTGIEFVEKLVVVNPMINCATVSSLSPKDFHEASEGLGILMQLPEKPEKEDIVKLINHLNNILNFTKKVSR